MKDYRYYNNYFMKHSAVHVNNITLFIFTIRGFSQISIQLYSIKNDLRQTNRLSNNEIWILSAIQNKSKNISLFYFRTHKQKKPYTTFAEFSP